MGRPRKPRCSALLKDGSSCRTWAGPSGLCKFHEQAESEPPPPFEAPVVEPLDLPAESLEALAVAPGQLRERFAADAAADYHEMVRTLRAAMGHGEKSSMLTCRKCGAREVYAGPDHKTRADAVAKWIELGFGKVKEQPQKVPIDNTVRHLRELSPEQLSAVADGRADIVDGQIVFEDDPDELPPAA